MQEVFENIIEKLRNADIRCPNFECWKNLNKDCGYCEEREIKVEGAIEIIKQVAAEYNNGWIPCSERLPEDGVGVLVCFEYFRYGNYNRMFRTVGVSYTYDGEWSGFVNGSSGWRDLTIFAWQPLPEPYQPKGE